MTITYKEVTLRDFQEHDIDDIIRWSTTETQWSDWDAPWEGLDDFNAEAYRKQALLELQQPQEDFRWRWQLDADGQHIGMVTSYLIDENWDWISVHSVQPGQKTYHTIGIDICDSRFWGRGLGTQALTAFIQYHLKHGISELCLQTWSGNNRMIRCAEKLGFVICDRVENKREVNGHLYDGLTYLLDTDRFSEHLREEHT